MFYVGILDVLVSCAYRVVISLHDVIRSATLNTFIVKLVTYVTNKTSRYYVKYFDQKNKKNNLAILWPIALAGIITNLIFDFTVNFITVFRSLNNKISWLSSSIVIGLSYTYMFFSSMDSCYQNTVSWYGILNGGFDDSAIKFAQNAFFVGVCLLEAIVSSLYFVVTTEMTLIWGVPICILLYFLPPFLQKYIDLSVIKNCVSNGKEATYDYPLYKLTAVYVVLANLIGLGFQLSSFTANISSGLPWLSAAMVMNVAIGFVVFYIVNALVCSGYTWAQFLFGVNFVDQVKFSSPEYKASSSLDNSSAVKKNSQSISSELPEDLNNGANYGKEI